MTRPGAGARFQALLFRLALHAFPAAFRGEHGAEMREAFRAERERRSAGGGLAGWSYTARAVLDALRQGTRERTRTGVPSGYGNRRTGRGGVMDGVWTDVRMAWRGLRRSPGFAVAAVVVLALGIGANTTVFSALKMAVLSPPPHPEPERMVLVDLTVERGGRGEVETMPWSYPKFREYLASPGRLVDPVAGYAGRSVTLTDPGDPEVLPFELVSPGYFGILGVEPLVGRAFTEDEGDASRPPMVAVLGHELWQSRFAGDRAAVGRDLILNGKPVRVVGVAPRGFRGLNGNADLWVPMAASQELFTRFMIRGTQAHWFHVVGRLVPGATLEEARAQTASIGDGIEEMYPSSTPGDDYSGSVRSFEAVRVNDQARASVWVMAAAALLVLLVTCANLSGLLLARVRNRSRDGAVRVAVGASRWRLIRASLVESTVVSLLGGAAGLLVALWGTRALAAAWPRRFVRSGDGEMSVMSTAELAVDPGVLGFAFAVTLLTALLFGLAPALRLAWSDVSDFLKDGRGSTRRGVRLLGLDGRSMLVGTQVALALVLVIGAGLLASSTKKLLDVEEGFRPDNLLTFTYTIPASNSRAEDPAPFHAEFMERLEALPEIETATIGCAPLRGYCWVTGVQRIEGGEPIPEGEGPAIGVRFVGDRHFEKLGIPILQGRTLDERDGTDSQPTMVLNKTAADELFPGENPLGRRIEIGVSDEGKEDLVEIVGVVGDVLYGPPDQDVIPEAYYSFREFGDRIGNITVRTTGEALAALPAIRRTLLELDPTLPIFEVATMDELIVQSVGDRGVVLGLFAIFAWVTLLLAATGTWGIVSYSVADRRRELGLRIALGAGRSRVLRAVLGESARAGAIGVGLGLLGGAFGSRLLETFLWQTSARDPLTFAGGVLLLGAVVALASYVPARRAVRVDPVEALKAE